MKNFKKILNNIAEIDHDLFSYAQSSNPCCAALSSFKNSQHIKNADDAVTYFLTSDRSAERKARTAKKYAESISGFLDDLIKNFCLCLDKPEITQSKPGFFQSINPFSRPFVVDQDSLCGKQLRDMFNPSTIDPVMQYYSNFNPNANLKTKVFIKATVSALNSMRSFFSIPISGSPFITQSTFFYFLYELCKFKKNNPDQYEALKSQWLTDYKLMSVATSIIDSFSVGVGDIESLTADCPPSTGDESVISLLGALGVGAAGVTVVGYLGAILKGNVKKCADKRQAAKKATTQLLALLGAGVGSFSATQVSEAEIVDRVEDIIIKDCEGRLPYSCGEGGFEGNDDEGGEPVDPPSGGEVGGIGGGLL